MKKPRLELIEGPVNVIEGAMRVADNRCADFFKHWQSLQLFPDPPSLMSMLRSVYLQGLFDGYVIGEKQVNEQTLIGLS